MQKIKNTLKISLLSPLLLTFIPQQWENQDQPFMILREFTRNNHSQVLDFFLKFFRANVEENRACWTFVS